MGTRVLVIDDQESKRRELAAFLTDSEYELAGEAGSGPEGLAKYQELKPDIVVVDIIMPGMDGIETVKQLMELDSEACVVCVSGPRIDALAMESLVAGAHEFVPRPLRRDVLLATFKKVRQR